MSVRVMFTRRAEQQVCALRRKQRAQLAAFVEQLRAQGCQALGYRLTGPVPLAHLCVRHLGLLRVVVGFQWAESAWILLIGPHDDSDPGMDLYTELYRLVGTKPPDLEKRRKPPCCDRAGRAPILGGLVEHFVDRAVWLRRTRG